MSRLADLKGGADSREEVLSDYRVYHLTGQEWIRYLLEGTAVCAVTAYVFYRSFLAFVLMLPAGMLRPFFKRRELCRRRKEELRLQFKEAIQIVASALVAGYSVENAFIASVRDLEEQYGKEGMITREFSYLASQRRFILSGLGRDVISRVMMPSFPFCSSRSRTLAINAFSTE